jgi:hypothetical protein
MKLLLTFAAIVSALERRITAKHEFHEFTRNNPITDSSLMQFVTLRGIGVFD